MTETIREKLDLAGVKDVYRGKVRDVYYLDDDLIVMAASNRISAFDVILPEPIPYKGAVLNKVAAKFLKATEDICPNWLLGTPAPHVAVGRKCTPYRVEMVIRAYLTGHAWRTYKSGEHMLCGVRMPDGLKEHDPFPEPIITPAVKAEAGHDEDISRENLLARGMVPEDAYRQMEAYTRALFARGTEMAAEKGLILVDTKYEFGSYKGEVMLMDEVHTPDSSRYFYAEGYTERQVRGAAQKQLSKEFVREWLLDNGFSGKAGQRIPEMTPEKVKEISSRYIELYERITGDAFDAETMYTDPQETLRRTTAFLKQVREKP